jgi:HSP20 family protein
MSIRRWEPFRDLISFKDRIDRLFDDAFTRPVREEGLSSWVPPVDIYETNENIVIKVELPGLNRDDFTIEIKDNLLTLKGEKKIEKDVKEENYHRIERSYGNFQRTFSLPSNVKESDAKAKYKDGILEIVIPKVEEAKPKQIKVDIQ